MKIAELILLLLLSNFNFINISNKSLNNYIIVNLHKNFVIVRKYN
jgi:hypothetical protein